MKKTIKLDKERRDLISEILTTEPKSEDEMMLDPNSSIVETADFGNGIEMDIKVCGVDFDEYSCNLPYTEAVLFDHGCEVACTEPMDEYLGLWELEYMGNTYEVEII